MNMFSRLTVRTASAFLFACFFLTLNVVAASLSGKVIGVSDGDTIDVLDGSKTVHRIRLTGIDAPEKAQPFGQRSKEHLSDTVFGKQVEVQAGKSDKYGRTVGKVLVKGVDANLEQVKAGFAWHYKQYASEQSVSDPPCMPALKKTHVACIQGFGTMKNRCRHGRGDTGVKISQQRSALHLAAHVATKLFVWVKKVGITASRLMEKSAISEVGESFIEGYPIVRSGSAFERRLYGGG